MLYILYFQCVRDIILYFHCIWWSLCAYGIHIYFWLSFCLHTLIMLFCFCRGLSSGVEDPSPGGSSKISPVLPTYFIPKKRDYFSLSLHCSITCLLLIYNIKHRLISLSTETIIKNCFPLIYLFFRDCSIVPSKLH